MKKTYSHHLGTTGILASLTIWWWLSKDSDNPFFPPLTALLTDAKDYWFSPNGLSDIAHTLSNVASGIAIGIFSGISGGLILGSNRYLHALTTPLIEMIRATPSVVLLPITISFLGIGDLMKISNIALIVAWPVLITTQDGYRDMPSQWLQTAHAYGLKRSQILRCITMPGLAPGILTGIRVALPLALVVGVTSEMVGETSGIGSIILGAQYTFDVPRMWSGVIVLSVIGLGLNTGFSMLSKAIIKKLS